MKYKVAPCPTCGVVPFQMGSGQPGVDPCVLQPCGHAIDGFYRIDGVIHLVPPGGLPAVERDLAVKELIRIARSVGP